MCIRDSLISDHEKGLYEYTASCCNHAKIGGRVKYLLEIGDIQVGRYKYHHMDYEIQKFLSKERQLLAVQNLQWKDLNRSANPNEARTNSLCENGYFCRGAEHEFDYTVKVG